MSDASRLLRREFDERARSINVTRQQWRVITVLARNEGINQAILADRLEVEPITLSRMIDRLQEAGLIDRRADPADRRAWRLYLSDHAAPFLVKLKKIGFEVSEYAMDGLSEAERASLTDLLERVRQNLSRKCNNEEGARAHG